MTAFDLRLAAVLAMTADHIGMVFFPGVLWWRVVGRLAWPMFAFLLVNGYRHTTNLKAYAGRLVLLAGLSQVPFFLVRRLADSQFWGWNIFVTLTLGLAAVEGWRRAGGKILGWLAVGAAAVAAQFMLADYGAFGVLLVVGLYLTYGRPKLIFLMMAGLVGAFYWRDIAVGYPVQVFSLAAVPLIASYNGRPGFVRFKWWFYAFYPVHLTVIYILKSWG